MSDKEDTGADTGPALVPQPHGGALLAGGKPGNKGGYGRTRSVVRQKLLRVLDEHGVDYLGKVLRGEVADATVSDRLRAVHVAGHLGLGADRQLTADAVRELLAETVRVIREEVPEDVAGRVLARMREIWR